MQFNPKYLPSQMAQALEALGASLPRETEIRGEYWDTRKTVSGSSKNPRLYSQQLIGSIPVEEIADSPQHPLVPGESEIVDMREAKVYRQKSEYRVRTPILGTMVPVSEGPERRAYPAPASTEVGRSPVSSQWPATSEAPMERRAAVQTTGRGGATTGTRSGVSSLPVDQNFLRIERGWPDDRMGFEEMEKRVENELKETQRMIAECRSLLNLKGQLQRGEEEMADGRERLNREEAGQRNKFEFNASGLISDKPSGGGVSMVGRRAQDGADMSSHRGHATSKGDATRRLPSITDRPQNLLFGHTSAGGGDHPTQENFDSHLNLRAKVRAASPLTSSTPLAFTSTAVSERLIRKDNPSERRWVEYRSEPIEGQWEFQTLGRRMTATPRQPSDGWVALETCYGEVDTRQESSAESERFVSSQNRLQALQSLKQELQQCRDKWNRLTCTPKAGPTQSRRQDIDEPALVKTTGLSKVTVQPKQEDDTAVRESSAMSSRRDGHTGDSESNSHRHFIKLGKYDGRTEVEAFLKRYEVCARNNGWSDSQRLDQLMCSLAAPADQLLWDIDAKTVMSWSDLVQKLRMRYGNSEQSALHQTRLSMLRQKADEELGDLVQEVRKLMTLAYPGCNAELGEVIAKRAFFDAMRDQRLALRVQEMEPSSLDQAFKMALRLDGYRKAAERHGEQHERRYAQNRMIQEPETTEADWRRVLQRELEPQGRRLERLERALESLMGNQEKSSWNRRANDRRKGTGWSAAPRANNDQSRRDNRCFVCHQEGHYAKNCTAQQEPLNSPAVTREGEPSPLGVAKVSQLNDQSLTYLHLTMNGVRTEVLIDSGSQRSLVPGRLVSSEKVRRQHQTLIAVNGTNIDVWGTVDVKCRVGRLRFGVTCLVSDQVDIPIFGVDWLERQRAQWNFDTHQLTIQGQTVFLRPRIVSKSGASQQNENFVRLPSGDVREVTATPELRGAGVTAPSLQAGHLGDREHQTVSDEKLRQSDAAKDTGRKATFKNRNSRPTQKMHEKQSRPDNTPRVTPAAVEFATDHSISCEKTDRDGAEFGATGGVLASAGYGPPPALMDDAVVQNFAIANVLINARTRKRFLRYAGRQRAASLRNTANRC